VVKLAQLQRSGFSCGKNRCNGLVPVPTLTRNHTSGLEPLPTVVASQRESLVSVTISATFATGTPEVKAKSSSSSNVTGGLCNARELVAVFSKVGSIDIAYWALKSAPN